MAHSVHVLAHVALVAQFVDLSLQAGQSRILLTLCMTCFTAALVSRLGVTVYAEYRESA